MWPAGGRGHLVAAASMALNVSLIGYLYLSGRMGGGGGGKRAPKGMQKRQEPRTLLTP